MAFQRGRQSGQTSTFMLAADVRAFDSELTLQGRSDGLPGMTGDMRGGPLQIGGIR